MTEARWTRIAGLCVLAALALQGAQQALDSAPQDHWVLCHLPLVLPDLPGGEPPGLGDAGFVVLRTAPPVAEAPLKLHPSRGPPA